MVIVILMYLLHRKTGQKENMRSVEEHGYAKIPRLLFADNRK